MVGGDISGWTGRNESEDGEVGHCGKPGAVGGDGQVVVGVKAGGVGVVVVDDEAGDAAAELGEGVDAEHGVVEGA